MTESSDYEKAEYAAAIWIIQLADDPDNAELQAEFESWRNESELNAELYDQTQKVSDLIENTDPVTQERWSETWDNGNAVTAGPEIEITKPLITTTPSNSGFSIAKLGSQLFTNWQKMTAGLAFACYAIFILVPTAQLHFQADYMTAVAEQQTVVLSDGSRVSLAPESAISVDFSPNQRHVHLLKGKAFFKISPNPNRPFKVDAGDTKATVLGTAFNVSLTEEITTITVEEGHVRVENTRQQPTIMEELLAGDRIRVSRQQGVERDQVAAEDIAAWRRGELVARNILMSDLVEAMRSYHQGAIVLQSSKFSNLRISGLYNLEDPITT